MSFFNLSRTPSIDEDKIVQEWSQLVLQMGNKGEELLKRITQKLQELNMPLVTLMRKEATLGKSNNRNEFISVKHEKYPDYEVWIGAIDRMGQLKVSWFLTVALPNVITAKIRAVNMATGGRPRRERLSRQLGKMLAQKLNQKMSGKPTPIRVRPDEMTMDDKEEFGVFMSLIHQAATGSLEEMMNGLNLDFSKVDTHTEGFLNLS